jgi:hypothetical protein
MKLLLYFNILNNNSCHVLVLIELKNFLSPLSRLWFMGTKHNLAQPILVPRASRPHASSLGPGTHRTGTARKLALISNAHGN